MDGQDGRTEAAAGRTCGPAVDLGIDWWDMPLGFLLEIEEAWELAVRGASA